MSRLWSIQEKEFLKHTYFSMEKEQLLKYLPKRTWDSMKSMAVKLGLRRDCITRNGSIEFLLQESYEAYYWAGFIMADGSINYKQNRLKVSLAIKDLEHLQKLASRLSTKVTKGNSGKYEICSLSIADFYRVISFVNKFGFKKNKTINPPTIPNFEENYFISFLIGFIDGDGSINKQYKRTDCSIKIKLHSNWLPVLQYIETRIYSLLVAKHKNNLTRINNQGYAYLCFSNREVINYLYNKTKELNLPVLSRKWDIIDPNRKYKSTKEQRLTELNKYVKLGLTYTKISELMGISKSYISTIKRYEKAKR
jgi:hypothetical protein